MLTMVETTGMKVAANAVAMLSKDGLDRGRNQRFLPQPMMAIARLGMCLPVVAEFLIVSIL
jgi:hypothetical protein